MPRVHFVKKARKDNPVCKAGESYYWWKFRYGGKRYSLTRPKRSQLTQSPYYGALYDLQDSVAEQNPQSWDDIDAMRDDVRERLSELRDECQESLDNMPEQLQYAPTGELLQERIDALEAAEGDLDNLDEFDEDEPQEHEFTTTCDDCDGSGQLDEDLVMPEDSDSDRECPTCGGSGEIEDESEYETELADWDGRREAAIDQAVSDITDAIDQCVV